MLGRGSPTDPGDGAAAPPRARALVADLRLLAPAASVWWGIYAGLTWSEVGEAWPWLLGVVGGLALVALLWGRRTPIGNLGFVVVVASLLGVCLAGIDRERALGDPLVAAMQANRPLDVVMEFRESPGASQGRFGATWQAQAVVRSFRLGQAGEQANWRPSAAVIRVTGSGPVPPGAEWGARFAGAVRLGPAWRTDEVAVARPLTDLALVRGPAWAYRAGAVVRGWIGAGNHAVQDHQPGVLAAALVSGQDDLLDPALESDFQVAGLTHLTAVSGTNLTLVLGFMLGLARLAQVSGRALQGLGLLGVVAFIVVAGPEPSVVRAAAMGTAGLVALFAHSRPAGPRSLSLAVLGLLLWQPTMGLSPGFALSALATAGLILLAPGLVAGLGHWLPRWLAMALAVPVAAQLICLPIIVAISGEISVVSVAANLVVEPLVAPATIIGLLAGLTYPVHEPVARVLGELAALATGGIIAVARWSAAQPGATVSWAASPYWLALVGCAAGLFLPRLARSRFLVLTVGLALALVTVRPIQQGWWGLDRLRSWPPSEWLLVQCDVGQGDALVLRGGPGRFAMIDVGPDASAARCLARLGVTRLDLLVLTHFHADHVAGLQGVLDQAPPARVWVSPELDPAESVAEVRRLMTPLEVPVTIPPLGARQSVGAWQGTVLGPGSEPLASEESAPNNASVVTGWWRPEVSLLATGDIEPSAQRALERRLAGRRFDVLKVPHHGSARQYPPLLLNRGARLALISAGADNDYGHPADATLSLLQAAGTTVARTDLAGHLAVVATPGGWDVVTLAEQAGPSG